MELVSVISPHSFPYLLRSACATRSSTSGLDTHQPAFAACPAPAPYPLAGCRKTVPGLLGDHDLSPLPYPGSTENAVALGLAPECACPRPCASPLNSYFSHKCDSRQYTTFFPICKGNLEKNCKKAHRHSEPHPVRRTAKNRKFLCSAANRCWPLLYIKYFVYVPHRESRESACIRRKIAFAAITSVAPVESRMLAVLYCVYTRTGGHV